MIKRYLHDIYIAVEAIVANKFKSFLTALGIIFGVAAVITMLAIGKGAQEEILEQMKLVGVNNIVITPIYKGLVDSEDEGVPQKFSKGLTMSDAVGILENIPTVNNISPHIYIDSYVVLNGRRKSVKLEAVTNSFFELFNYKLEEGKYFNQYHLNNGKPVCIIGATIKSKFFQSENPIGRKIKCGNEWLTVIGVLEKRNITSSGAGKVDQGDSNNKIYLPVKTMLLRYRNRSLITKDKLRGTTFFGRGFVMTTSSSNGSSEENYHQLDKLIVQVKETDQLNPTKDLLTRYLLRRHSKLMDFDITVPELLLKQQQKTKDVFNIVLGAIASISLLVGGIGIMNIMLASVMERIKEIGIRQAIGATRKDIIVQFLSESTLISLVGGVIGIFFGVILSDMVSRFAEIKTVVSSFSVFIAFGVSVSVGIIFGYIPAKRASEKDPIDSLRHE